MDKWLPLVVVSSFLAGGWCDFPCICNFQAQLQIFPDTSHTSLPVGYLYESDCKEDLILPGIGQQWFAVAYKHQIAYVQQGSQVRKNMCPGQPSADDLVTTLKPATMAPMMSAEVHANDNGTRSAAMTTAIPTTPPPTTPATTTLLEHTFYTATSTMKQIKSTQQPNTATEATTIDPDTTPTTPSRTLLLTMTQGFIAIAHSTAAPTPASRATEATTTVATTTVATTAAATTATTTTATPTTLSTTPVATAATTPQPTETSTMAMITGSSSSPSTSTLVIGNTQLCSPAVHQYTFNDNGYLTQYGDKCYELIPHVVSWAHAEHICNQRHGHLVQISDAHQQSVLHEFIMLHYQHRVWLGLHDRQHEEQFQWTSGKPVTYLNWSPGRKTTNHDFEDCVYMDPVTLHGQWDDVKCGFEYSLLEPLGESHAYMCQYDALSPDELAIAGNINLCPSIVRNDAIHSNGVLGQHNQACYELLVHQKVTFSHAESMCQSRGGHLAYITSATEQAYIQKFMLANSPTQAVWIGLHDRQTENHFQWTSGVSVSYTNWVPGHTSNFASHTVEDCVAFIPYKSGMWDDIQCGQHLIFFGDGGETHPILCQYRTVAGAGLVG